MLERDIRQWAKRLAKNRGWYVRAAKSMGRRSFPDDLFAKQIGNRKTSFYGEAKATGEKPTVLQEQEHAEMRAAGLSVYVYDSRELFQQILDMEEATLADPG